MKYVKEFLTFPDIVVMSLLCLINVCITIIYADHASVWLAVPLGMLGFSITEYVTHRFLFHLKAPRNPFFLKMLKRLHYDHHADPDNLHLLFLPLWYSIPLMIITGGIVYAFTTTLIITNAFISGVMLFFLLYEWTHYIAHRPVQPLTTWGKWMKKVHKWHHYKNENYWYGVTHPGFDYVMGTFKDHEEVEKSPTARKLENRGKDIGL